MKTIKVHFPTWEVISLFEDRKTNFIRLNSRKTSQEGFAEKGRYPIQNDKYGAPGDTLKIFESAAILNGSPLYESDVLTGYDSRRALHFKNCRDLPPRFTLEVTGSTVLPIQELTEKDLLDSGIFFRKMFECSFYTRAASKDRFKTGYGWHFFLEDLFASPRDAFIDMWNVSHPRPKVVPGTTTRLQEQAKHWLKINPDTTSYDKNPFVVKTEFSIVSAPEHLMQFGACRKNTLYSKPT